MAMTHHYVTTALDRRQVHLLSPKTSTPERLRIAMEMLRKTTSKVSEMAGQFAMMGLSFGQWLVSGG